MKDTISHVNVANWWNGKVIIDEIKIYADSRGMVSEVWRIDSALGIDSKQCYISETAPYIQRGPHQHVAQDDNFISWKNIMVYQMFNPETNEMKTFITEKNKIYRVNVKVPIIHSYRNLDKDKSFTLNFPTALFMGEGKKEEIDEIRHEEKSANNSVYVIFGANGKLGKAITARLYSTMNEHEHDVIPVYEKLKNKNEVFEFFNRITLSVGENRDVYIVNCAALTNAQDVNTIESLWEWTNIDLPVEFAKQCNLRTWKFVQFSTDYVYQKNPSNIFGYTLSPYTRSKIEMEKLLLSPGFEKISIVRIANLYAIDTQNFVYKMKKSLAENGLIKVDPRIKIFPSNVDCIAKKFVELIKSHNFDGKFKYTNLYPKTSYYITEFVEKYFGVIPIEEKGKIEPWHEEFTKCDNSKYIDDDSDENIKRILLIP